MINITLSAGNMGPETTEGDFDAWAAFVGKNIGKALGIEDFEIEQYKFGIASEDDISGASEDEREAIRGYLAHEGWDAFCAESGPDSEEAPEAPGLALMMFVMFGDVG